MKIAIQGLLLLAALHTVHGDARAQDCAGTPITRRAVAGAAVTIAEDWTGVGGRLAAGSDVVLAVDADVLRHADGPRAWQASARAGVDGDTNPRLCAFITTGAFSRERIPRHVTYADTTYTAYDAELDGRYATIGIGTAHWHVTPKLRGLVHVTAEGMILHRNRTSDGAFVFTVGGGLVVGRWFLGSALRSATPFETVLTGRPTRLLLRATRDLG